MVPGRTGVSWEAEGPRRHCPPRTGVGMPDPVSVDATVTRSTLPSPLKSPTASESGIDPVKGSERAIEREPFLCPAADTSLRRT